jgi:Zn-dependent peptidase ImmA (M78 family)
MWGTHMATEQLALDLGDYGWETMSGRADGQGVVVGHFRDFLRSESAWTAASIFDAADRAFRDRPTCMDTNVAAIVGSTQLSPERTAAELRVMLGYANTQPIDNMVEVARTLGCLLAAMPPHTANRTSFSAWFHHVPVMLLRTAGANRRRVRFDAAHELGHLVMHRERRTSSRDDIRETEREANAFAAAFLMPVEAFEGITWKPFSWESVHQVTDRCNVNLLATLRRAHDLGFISKPVHVAANAQANSRGWKVRDPYDVLEPEPFSIG